MSFNQNSRKFQRGARNSMTALAERIRVEGRELIQRAVSRAPAKVIALRTAATPRQVYNWRERECDPRWVNFIMLARECPELKAAVARWLELDTAHDPRAQHIFRQIIRYAKSLPEEGDMANDDYGAVPA